MSHERTIWTPGPEFAARVVHRSSNPGSWRASSYDPAGGNHDFLRIGPGETVTLLEQDGPSI